MPVFEVTYDDTVDEPLLHRLGQLLPNVVSEAVDLLLGPADGPARRRRHRDSVSGKSAFDVGGLNAVVELRTKLFESRIVDKQRRADLIRDRLSSRGLGKVGVWLILAEGAWSKAVKHP